MNNSNKRQNKPEDNFLNVRDLLALCLAKWYWFVISLVITMGVGLWYILKTPPTYTRTAKVLLKVNDNGDGVNQLLTSMGMGHNVSNIYNEGHNFESSALMYEVVQRMNLHMDYYVDGRFHKQVVYGTTLPANVSMIDWPENEYAGFTLSLLENDKISLSDFTYYNGGEKIVDEKIINGAFSDTIKTPVGNLVVNKSASYKKGDLRDIYVSHNSPYSATKIYSSKLTVLLNDDPSTIVNLTVVDVCPERAEDLLNTLINVYNENWVKDKNKMAVSTSMFINERLAVIEQELGHVDENISSFKSENLLPDVQAASNLYMSQSTKANEQILELNNQLYMTGQIKNYLVSNNNNDLLPVVAGVSNSNIESQIKEYNSKLLERNNLVMNSSEKNPLVKDLDESLSAIRNAIRTSVDNQQITLATQINTLQREKSNTTARIAANPSQAKYLLSVERQQKVKEALYLFLLQKREENELSQAFSAYNTRVMNPPSGSMAPTAPVRKSIYLMSFALGLLIPLVIIFIKEISNTKIRGRKDIEGLIVPFLGELPQNGSKSKSRKGFEFESIVVEDGNRNIINEAFRVLRSNLEFMTGKDKKSNVILSTSFNPGSGKTFVTLNLALSLAIKGKKVLVIDGDLRHASASNFVGAPHHGITDYLSHTVNGIDDLLISHDKYSNLNLLPVGIIPPNPTELLYDSRFSELVKILRDVYDYIFIDCPPIEIVADTQIIASVADRTIFIARAGLMEKEHIVELDKIYEDKKYPNMCVVLNGTEGASGQFSYRSGYRYGYKYGYSYGYGNDKK